MDVRAEVMASALKVRTAVGRAEVPARFQRELAVGFRPRGWAAIAGRGYLSRRIVLATHPPRGATDANARERGDVQGRAEGGSSARSSRPGTRPRTSSCLNNGLAPVTLADTPAKARLFSVVPSLDTPVCSTQTKKFDEGIAALKDKVACYTVSLDLPFAQKRFCSGREHRDHADPLRRRRTARSARTGAY